MSKDKDLQLSQALDLLLKASKRGCIILDGVIKDVDKDKFTCTVLVSGSPHYNVPLKVLISSQASIIEIPKVETTCLMTFRDGNTQRPQIFSVHEAEQLLITCDDIQIKSSKLKLNDLNISKMLTVINGTPINEPGNGSPSAFQTALKNALHA